MKMIKKNQVIIFVMALMLITAGYLNYTGGEAQEATAGEIGIASIGDAKLVNGDVSNTVYENALVENENVLVENKVQENTNTIQANTANTNVASNNSDDYFTSSKLSRDTMYSQMLESYQKIMNNSSMSQEQKAISQEEIKKINDTKNSIMISENLIKLKGFEDCVIFINDSSVNIVIKKQSLQTEDIAQIQNIISREMKAEIEDIHITNK